MINRQTSFYSCKLTGINGKTEQPTLFFATDTGNYRPTHLIIDLTSVSDLVTSATISVGTNAQSYNNLLSDTLLNLLSSGSNSIVIPITGLIPDIAAATEIYINVGVAATATTYVFNTTLVGFYDR